MTHTIIEFPEGKAYFTAEELSRLLANAKPIPEFVDKPSLRHIVGASRSRSQASKSNKLIVTDEPRTELADDCIRIVMAKQFLLELIAGMESGIVPVHDPVTGRKTAYSTGLAGRLQLIAVEDCKQWAEGCGLQVRDAPAEQDKAPEETPAGGALVCDSQAVTVTLPHMTKTLEAVIKVMRENWTDYDPKRMPKQVNIALEIDAAMGWRQERDGTPSRNAKAIAAMIKPDDNSDTE